MTEITPLSIVRQAEAVGTSRALVHYRAVEIVEQAFAKFGIPEIVNIDQGSQFAAEEFTSAMLRSGTKLSIDGRGAWRDNMFVERLWRSANYERVYLRAYESVNHARADMAEYIDWYNSHRGHTRRAGH